MVLLFPSLHAATVVDLDTLHQDILLALSSDPIATNHISADGRWSTDPNGLLLLDNRIYVPSAGNLRTCVLQYNHDHILAGHFGQNKTLELVCHGYFWPSLHADIQQLCDPSYNVTTSMDPSNNSLSLNDHGIPFLWTSSRNFHHPPGLTLSWS